MANIEIEEVDQGGEDYVEKVKVIMNNYCTMNTTKSAGTQKEIDNEYEYVNHFPTTILQNKRIGHFHGVVYHDSI